MRGEAKVTNALGRLAEEGIYPTRVEVESETYLDIKSSIELRSGRSLGKLVIALWGPVGPCEVVCHERRKYAPPGPRPHAFSAVDL